MCECHCAASMHAGPLPVLASDLVSMATVDSHRCHLLTEQGRTGIERETPVAEPQRNNGSVGTGRWRDEGKGGGVEAERESERGGREAIKGEEHKRRERISFLCVVSER